MCLCGPPKICGSKRISEFRQLLEAKKWKEWKKLKKLKEVKKIKKLFVTYVPMWSSENMWQ